MAKIETLDFVVEILKNQFKIRKHTPPPKKKLNKCCYSLQFEYNISSFGLIFCPKYHF